MGPIAFWRSLIRVCLLVEGTRFCKFYREANKKTGNLLGRPVPKKRETQVVLLPGFTGCVVRAIIHFGRSVGLQLVRCTQAAPIVGDIEPQISSVPAFCFLSFFCLLPQAICF